jgi:hypothetical protein
MNKLITILLISVGFSACKKENNNTVAAADKPKYSAAFEVTIPIQGTFCPVAIKSDNDVLARLESELEENGGGASKYIHCKACSIGVLREGNNGIKSCSYCGDNGK